ncbi:DUF1467 family protein [Asticcacaulis sp. AC402]|uniref:DUF1467 family protein n=1 Tax=Asticcacaulis sp. AC402 TaxID=1282361 RepID=UPI0003C3C8C5|nr:DUF1467 family protein [Asticcacaulis sp. AC402]ESQ75394.1 hypothetical protein ABAC402_09850 [Asticcacaulis sp. AC402]
MFTAILTWLAFYIMIWWITLFVVLPIGGNPSQHEAGVEVIKGNDPGAPVNPRLWQKVKLNSIVAAVVWVVVLLGSLLFRVQLPAIVN